MATTETLHVCVVRKSAEAFGICTLELASTEGDPLPAFSAGSHIDLHLDGGITRQYSLCNAPSEDHRYLIGVQLDPNSRGGSRAVHESVHEGDLLRISAPKNHFGLARGASHSLLLAGGIGITPILCMTERLAVTGDSFETHYCARSAERCAFRERIAASGFANKVSFHFDDGKFGERLDVGKLLVAQPGDTHLYVCGPAGFMDAALSAARGMGWAEERLHYEFFGAVQGSPAIDVGFEVELASSGRVVFVAADMTVTQALSDAGIEIQTSCGQGVCGTCITKLLSGEPDHRDVFMSPTEQAANDQFAPCCSRSKSRRLVLDL